VPLPDKVLITNISALRAKYGTAGVERIKADADRLIAADAARGLVTRLVAVDDGRTARQLGVPPVRDAADPVAAKRTIDAIADLWNPAYLVLLGSDDVIPTQPLKNPLYQPGPTSMDDDLVVESDLPYASEHPYSERISDFRGVTRVVGRIPDGQSNKSTGQLRTALRTAAGYIQRPRAKYDRPWALSVADWHYSTSQTLTKIFGSAATLIDVPPTNKLRPGDTHRLLHLFNCHGASNRPQMKGQRGWYYEVVMNPKDLLRPGLLNEGTIVASECCYTGKMVAPNVKSGPAFVDVYMRSGAYAFVGSSTEVWGGIDYNADADLLVGYFVRHLMDGMSTGRAMLQARHEYVIRNAVLSPTDLKTLGQFALFGDPSIHPVATGRVPIEPGVELARGLRSRRARLSDHGRSLHATTPHAGEVPIGVPAKDHDVLLAEMRAQTGHKFGAAAESRRFPVHAPGARRPTPGRHFDVVHETSERGTHAALVRMEDGVAEELRLLQRR